MEGGGVGEVGGGGEARGKEWNLTSAGMGDILIVWSDRGELYQTVWRQQEEAASLTV